MASDSIIACACGRTFLSEADLEQHRRDTAISASDSVSPSPCVNIEVSQMPKSAPKEMSKDPEICNTKDRWMAEGIGDVIEIITSASLEQPSSELSISYSDQYDVICSYNWVNKEQPTIYVPGGAPNFAAIPLPTTIKPDSNRHVVDQTATKIPDLPLEVVFRAAELVNPFVSFDKIDVLTNRKSLGKLFDFCKGRVQQSFRFNLHLINDTLIIEECSRPTVGFLYDAQISVSSYNFKTQVTRWPSGLEDSLGHHRTVRYDFGGLNCAVCTEVHASYTDPEASEEDQDHASKAEAHGEDIASLATAFSLLAVKEAGSVVDGCSAEIIHRGAGTEQATVAGLNSKATNSSKTLKSPLKLSWDCLLQNWLGRTHYLVTGLHEDGILNDVHVLDLKEKLEIWEKHPRVQDALKNMASLLACLRDVVRMTEAKSSVLLCEQAPKDPVLRIHASTSHKEPLPGSVVEKFWNKREV